MNLDRIRKDYNNYKIYAVIVLILIFVALDGNTIGVRASDIEKDARKSQKIEESWNAFKDTKDTMSTVLFYPEDLSDFTFSIYVNRPGFSFGYFFRAGGSTWGIAEDIAEVTIDDYKESAYLSMNKKQVSEVRIEKGNNTTIMNIDSEKPFALVLPNSNAKVTFYSTKGKVIRSIPVGM